MKRISLIFILLLFSCNGQESKTKMKKENTIIIKDQDSFVFALKDNAYTVNFAAKSIVPKSDDIYFENNFLVIKKTSEDDNPHNLLTYRYYFTLASNTIQLNKIDFSKETYVEQDDICKLSYTYIPINDPAFSLTRSIHLQKKIWLHILGNWI